MKKKFDLSAEMSKVESVKTTPKNRYLEEEKRLSSVNTEEPTSLNDNVYKLETEVENLSNSIRECKPIVSEEMHKLAAEFGAAFFYSLLGQTESKCEEAEQRMKKANNAILVPDTALYTLIIIIVALSSFFVCMIEANAETLHSVLIWRAIICCIIMIVFGTGIAVTTQRFLDRDR